MISYALPAELIIDDLYAGVLDSSRWQSAMERIVDVLGATSAGIFAFDPSRAAVIRDEGYRASIEHMHHYREWVAAGLEPRQNLAVSKPVLATFGDPQLMPLRSWRSTQIFNDFLSKVDRAYFLCSWLHKSDTRMVAFSVHASQKRGLFDEHDHRQLRPLLPHIARALEIRDRLESNAIRADILSTGLDRASFGLMILDAGGRLLESNAVAEGLLRTEPSVFRDREGVLRLRGKAGIQLSSWIRHGRPKGGPTEGVIHVERLHKQPLSLLIALMPEAATTWCGFNYRWMLFWFDPEAEIEASVALLVTGMGISEREAQIASLLAAGYQLQQVAGRLGISVHTARVHLKSIFSKTGVRSQAELVRRVMQSPALFSQ